MQRPTIEHVVPKSRGGAGLRNNVAASCWKCNNERGNALLTPEQQAHYERIYGPE